MSANPPLATFLGTLGAVQWAGAKVGTRRMVAYMSAHGIATSLVVALLTVKAGGVLHARSDSEQQFGGFPRLPLECCVSVLHRPRPSAKAPQYYCY